MISDTSPLRIAVVGSRGFDDYKLLSRVLDNFFEGTHFTLVCGMARGADLLGFKYAKRRGWDIEEYPAKWDEHGKSAGYIRNELMSRVSDIVVAFWDGESKGTKHMITMSLENNCNLVVINYKGECSDSLV